MGSYNVSCSITDISINSGEKMVFIPLIQSDRLVDLSKAPSVLYSVDYYSNVNNLFTPFSLPIECEYNDYGQVANVKKNMATEHLEERFGLSIKDIINIILSQDNIYDWGNELQSSLLDEDFVAVLSNYEENRTLSNLIKFGFSKEGNTFVHSELPNFKITEADDDLVKIQLDDLERTYVPNIDQILRLISIRFKKYLGLKQESVAEKLLLLDTISGMTIKKDVYEFLIKADDSLYNESDIEKSFEEFKSDLELASTEEGKANLGPFHPLNSKYFIRYSFIENLKRLIPDYELFVNKIANGTGDEKLIMNFIAMKNNMYCLNKMFRPSCSNTQFSEVVYMTKFVDLMSDILKTE